MDSLIKFSAEVINGAEKNRDEALSSLREKEKERLKTAEKDIKSGKESRVRTECEKIKLETEKEVALLKNDLKKDILIRREEMFDEVFSKVRENIEAFRKSPQYISDMIDNIKKAAEILSGGEVECSLLPEDIEAVKKEIPSLVYKEAEEDIIGGFTLMNKEKHLYLDMTLSSKIEQQKKNFYRKSGLVLD